ncbi:MAG: transposase [Rhizobacter sp.]|nr:transposase [Rhizobacter sp.]
MSDEMEELVGRLVVGRKRDGHKVFHERVKAELVTLCAKSGASVSKLARECDLNANQLSRWIWEHEQGRQRAVVARSVATREAFVELPVMATAASSGVEESSGAMSVQAWLPNGVVVDVRGVELRQTVEPTD